MNSNYGNSNAMKNATLGGALLTYAWYGFPQLPTIGSKGVVDLISNGIFAIGAIVLLAISAKRNSKGTANYIVC